MQDFYFAFCYSLIFLCLVFIYLFLFIFSLSFPCPWYQNVPLSLALSPRIISEVANFKPDIIHASSPGIMVCFCSCSLLFYLFFLLWIPYAFFLLRHEYQKVDDNYQNCYVGIRCSHHS